MLKVDALTRSYGATTVVDRVSFEVPAGMMTGFVGANGAGKTTTMRMIMGVLEADSGECTLNGEPLTAQSRSRFGYIPEERGLFPAQPILEQLTFLGQLHAMSATDARRSASELLERFDLLGRAKDKLESLSLGNQQRVQIAAALLHDPVALVLDEPFSGLDPDAVDEMVSLLRERCAHLPILFSSHQLDLVDRLCDHLVVLSGGRVVASGDVHQLRDAGDVRYRIRCAPDAGWLRGMPGVHVIDLDGPSALIRVDSEATLRSVTAQAVSRGGLDEFSRLAPSLSEIFREATR